jgi:nitrite reductase (NADH) small subunit
VAREWRRVGRVADFPRNAVSTARVAGHEIVIVRTRKGFHAVRNKCPHQGAPLCGGILTGTFLPSGPGTLRYGREQAVLCCPWHGWEFDVETGEPLYGISTKKLVTYPTEERGAELWVQISDRSA